MNLKSSDNKGRVPLQVRPGLTVFGIVGPLAAAGAVFSALLSILDADMPFWLWRFSLSSTAGLTTGLTVHLVQRHLRDDARATVSPPDDPSSVLAASLVSYAQQLAATHRDQAVVDLRGSTSRLLHLLGANDARQTIGLLALDAASALGDRISQASVLLDDLGWSLHESGRSADAMQNIEEAIELLTEEMKTRGEDQETLLELRSKAQRHLAVIRSDSIQVNDARALLAAARSDIANLPDPARLLNQAQIDFSEASIILRGVERGVGQSTVFEPGSQRHRDWLEGLAIAEQALASYSKLGDLERQGKAMGLRVRYLRHDKLQSKAKEAEAQLDRITAQLARNVKALTA